MEAIKKMFLFGCCVFFASACNNAGNVTSSGSEYNDTTYKQHPEYNTQRGMDLFRQKCSACHGLNGNYRSNNAADLSVSVVDSQTIVTTIINGKNTMPPFGHTINDTDLGQIAHYVISLRHNNKPS